MPYNEWRAAAGTTFASDGGFEVWKVKTYPVLPVISIVDTANPASPVSAGTAIGFDITVSNTGAADATNVTISDPLPAGGDLDWSLSPAFTGCAITGVVGTETLKCTFVTLAAGASIGPIHITSATTQADCPVVSNTATAASGNDDGGSSTDSVSVQCAAIKILTASSSPVPLSVTQSRRKRRPPRRSSRAGSADRLRLRWPDERVGDGGQRCQLHH